MPRWTKILIKIIAFFIALIVLVWMAAAVYINLNKKAVLNSVMEQLNKNIKGKLNVGSMEPTLLQGFPGVSVSLKDVLLQDSLWLTHRHNLLQAHDVGVSIDALSLIFGKTEIKKVKINDATIYLFTDSNGYSNADIFRSGKGKKKTGAKSGGIEIKRFELNKVNFILDNRKRLKLFHFEISDLNGKVDYPDSGWNAAIKLKTFVRDFTFNARKGSFLKNKPLEGNLSVHYSEDSGIILADPEKMLIGSDAFFIGAKVELNKNPSPFTITISSEKILYRNAAALLAPNISKKLRLFDIEKPMSVQAIIEGGTGVDPRINVSCKVLNSKLVIPGGTLTQCSFNGLFTNQDTASKAISDDNSSIKFFHLSGNYYNAPFKVDTLLINNLQNPVATGLVTSSFPLKNLNSSEGGETFYFKDGTSDLRLFCRADINNFRFTKPVITGKIQIKDADITYLPRRLHLVKSSLALNFSENNLSLNDARLQVGNSVLNMEGNIRNFLNFYYTAPEKILLDWKISSPQLYLNEFIPFLGPRNGNRKKSKSKNAMQTASEQLATVLDVSKVHMQLHVDKAIYNKFLARDLNAEIALLGDGIYLQKMNVNHAGGKLLLSGNVIQQGPVNKFTIKSTVSNASIKDFFYAFDNFGQTGLTSKNLNGYLSALVNVSGSITDKGTLVSRSMKGKINFNLKKGALQQYEPILTIGKLVFPKRNLNDIRLDNLDGTFTVDGDKINISPMFINSSAINLNVKGVYSLSSGTNIVMDIPVRNPKKDELITDKDIKKERRMKGLVLHLKAIDGDDGKIKIRWNKDHD